MKSKKRTKPQTKKPKTALEWVVALAKKIPDEEAMDPAEVAKHTGLALKTIREAIARSGLGIVVSMGSMKVRYLTNAKTARKYGSS